jgi:AcrR family transcriptional regulator
VRHSPPPAGAQSDAGEALRQLVVDAATEKIALKAARQAERVKAKAARHVEALDRLAAHLEAIEVWTRMEPGRRQPRFNREEIAATAVWIADNEGFDALSMRRIAAELGAGTMTLYHYVRTKDELLALVMDAVMGEVVLPTGESLPDDWREAMTTIAHRSREALRRHPWVLDIADDPAVGPNSVRHFDQSLRALAALDVDLATKLDIISVVDEYVFGYCFQQRTAFQADAAADDEQVLTYVSDLVAGGGYPELERLLASEGASVVWAQVLAHLHDPDRFQRNLARVLDGIERDLSSPLPSSPPGPRSDR